MAVVSIVGTFNVGTMVVGQQGAAYVDAVTVSVKLTPDGYEQTFSYIPVYTPLYRATFRFGPF